MPGSALDDGAQRRIGHLVASQREGGIRECQTLVDDGRCRPSGGDGASYDMPLS